MVPPLLTSSMTPTTPAGDNVPLSRLDNGSHPQSSNVQRTERPTPIESSINARRPNTSFKTWWRCPSIQSALRDLLTRLPNTPLTKASFTTATFIITIFGLTYFSYRQDQISRWTAAKDFYTQCQLLWVRYSIINTYVGSLVDPF